MIAFDHSELGQYSYVVVNPLQVQEGQWKKFPHTVLLPAGLDAQSRLMPILLDIKALSAAEVFELLDLSVKWDRDYDEPFFSALLKTDAGKERVVKHLSAQQLVRGPDGQKNLLRFHDPRVFMHLVRRLTAEQLAAVLGPVNKWTWRGPDLHWHTTVRAARPPISKFQPVAADWDKFIRMGLLNRTLTQLRRLDVDIKLDDGLIEKVDELLAVSYSIHALDDDADRRLYAQQAILYGDSIHGHPELTERLSIAKSGDCSYVGACGDLDDQSMRRLALELAHQKREGIRHG